MAPQPFYTTALEIPTSGPSPTPYTPPFSPPPSSDSASSALEHRYLKQTRVLHTLRLILSGLFVALTAAIVGCTGDALRKHNATNLAGNWFLPLWPNGMDMKGVTAEMACAVVVLTFSLAYFVVSIPSPRAMATTRTLLFTITSLFSLAVSLFSLAYYLHRTHLARDSHIDTLQSWTCHLSSSPATVPSQTRYGNLSIDSPEGFGHICSELKAAFATEAVLVGLLMVGCGVAAAGWWVEGVVRVARRREGINNKGLEG
ncbi:MAG: hypothetical protein Q9227_000583 [Pyrenula ochraceoflavens]